MTKLPKHQFNHYIHICNFTKINNIKQSNLPVNLETFNVIAYDILNEVKNVTYGNGEHNQFKKNIIKNCKIPFNCETTVEFLNFDE